METRDIQCLGKGHMSFKCSNKSVIILRKNDLYNIQDDSSSSFASL